MIRLVAFLGNHGREYSGNRHNVAWHFCAWLPSLAGLSWNRKFKGAWAKAPIGEGLVLIKPETYMNLSGDCIAEAMGFFRVDPSELLVVHDELELPFGTFGLKNGGGLGGHNGLRSLKARLGTADFMRFRFGIGRPSHDDVAGYVLSDFSREERETLDSLVFPKALDAWDAATAGDPEEALARYAKVKAFPE